LVNYRVAGFAGRSLFANVDVAIAHDCYPLLKSHHNAQLLRKVACDQRRSLAAPLRFTVADQPGGFSTRERLRTRIGLRTRKLRPASHFRMPWRDQMRALSYIIALVLVLTGPSLAGSADRDVPGVGTLIYCGSPILTLAPDLMAAGGQ
jgi:hypothetical protein